MSLTRTVLLAASCLFLAAPLPAADKLSLRTHYESGKVYTLETNMEMSTGMPAAGAGANQQTTMTLVMTISVKDDPGTTNRLATVKFTSIKASMNMAGQVVNFDSADSAKALPYLQQAFGALVGREFTLVYDKDDKVIDARGMDTVAQTPVAGGRSMDGKQMVDAFKKSQELFLPPQPVGPGDTWTYEGKVEMQPIGTFESKGSGKFDGILEAEGHKHAKLVINGSLAMPESNTPARLSEGSTVTVEMLYDLDRHVADTTTTVSEIKINAAGQEISMKQKDVTKLTAVTDAAKEAAPASSTAPVPAAPETPAK